MPWRMAECAPLFRPTLASIEQWASRARPPPLSVVAITGAFRSRLLPQLPAFVRFGFLALEDVVDLGDGAAGPMLELGADLIVSGRPGEGLEHFGRGCRGFHNPHQHGVLEGTDDLDDLGGGRRS